MTEDPRIAALPDIHGHAKGEHKPFAEERPIPYTARMLFLWFYHACRRGSPRFLMVADHMNYLTFEDPAAVNLVRRALKLAQAGDLYGAAETAGVDLAHAAAVSEGLRKGIRYSIGAEVDNDPRCRPDAQNIVDAMRPDGMVRSVHFLPITHPQHGENWMWPFDNPEFAEFFEVVGTERVWEIYMETLLEAIEKLPGHIVAHFYVPAKFGHWPDDAVLAGYEDRLLDACAERGMAVEVNSRYLYKFYAGNEAQLERFRAAHLRLLRKAKEKGVAIAVGSDAHSPKDQGRAFDAVLELLDEAEINEIAFPINGRLARVALRATEEILRQQSVATVAPPPPAAASANGSSGAPVEAPLTVTAGSPPEHASRESAGAEAPAASLDVDVPEPEIAAEPVLAVAKKRPSRKKAPSAAPPRAQAEPSDVPVLDEPELVPATAAPPAAHPVADEPVAEPVAALPAVDERALEEPALEEPAVSAEAVVAEEPVVAAQPPDAGDPVTAEALAESSPPPVDVVETAVPEVEATPALPRAKPRAKPAPKANPKTAPKPPVKAASRTAPKRAAAPPSPAKTAPAKTAGAKPAAKKAAAPAPAAKKAAPKAIAKKTAVRAAKKKAAPKKAASARPAPAKAAKKAAPKRAAPAKKTSAKKVKKKAARPRR